MQMREFPDVFRIKLWTEISKTYEMSKKYVRIGRSRGLFPFMEAEKGAWFKIGVSIQNPTDESKDAYVSVKNVEVRIASAKEVEDGSLSTEQSPSEEDAA